MTSLLVPTRTGRRRFGAPVYRAVRAGFVAALVLGPAGLPARAEEPDSFSTTITTDATAETTAKARDNARLDGQRRALAAVVERLAAGTAQGNAAANAGANAPANAAAKLTKLDDKTITDLVASFEVANERMSAVHYAADFTFHFRPAELRRTIRAAGIALGGDEAKPDSGKPPVIIPVLQSGGQLRLWDDPNPWRDAWSQLPAGRGGGSRFAVPLGDAGDIAAIDAEKARAGDADALAAFARRNGGGEALVVLAATRGPPDHPTAIEVTARRYRAGRLIDSHVEPITANPGEGESDLLGRAAAAVVAEIESGWKKEAVPGYDQVGSLTAVLPVTSLDDWVRARDRLAGVAAIRKISLVALSRQEATIEIGYAGSIDQLKTSLAAISLDLVRGDPLWRLARTGPDRSP